MSGVSRIFSDHSGGMTPARTACRVALLFFLLGILYILLSSWTVSTFATSTEEAQRWELAKGILFILIITLLLYLGLKIHLTHVREKEEELQTHSMALIVADKKASLGLVTATLGHDIKNLVQVLSASAEQLKFKDHTEAEQDMLLESIVESSEQMRVLSERLISSARHNVKNDVEMLDVQALARSVSGLLERHAGMRRIKLRDEFPEKIRIEGNRMALQQTLLNLILNAADAIDGEGEIRVRGYRGPEKEHYCLEVHDSGTGVPRDERKKIFSALYTTKSSGTGLGLLSVKACAKIHEGFVEVDDSPLGGACFRLCLPVRVEEENA